VAAADPAALCRQVRECIVGRSTLPRGLPRSLDYVITDVTECGDLRGAVEAPAASVVKTIAFLTVQASLDGVDAEGSYLIAKRRDGHCLIDNITLPDMNTPPIYYETAFATRWQRHGVAHRLNVQANRIRVEPLGQEELAAQEESSSEHREPDVDTDTESEAQTCTRVEYELAGGVFRRVRKTVEDSPCTPLP
jgi:hypothetical protein